ncbi:MAG: 30S ribosomal protein S4 [Gammaproteobacteria bacterium]
MARYLGPTCRVARRIGTDLGLKSRVRDVATKCKLTVAPGQHGAKKSRTTDYGLQSRAKQQIKYTYGVLERQFRKYYHTATKRKGATGEILLKILESRLDNVVYRMGFGCTRAEARQLVRHRAIAVNGKTVSIPSFEVPAGAVVEVREKARSQTRINDSLKLAQSVGFSDWIDVDVSKLSGTFKRVPDRSELPSELNEQLVVELYSKS